MYHQKIFFTIHYQIKINEIPHILGNAESKYTKQAVFSPKSKSEYMFTNAQT